MTVEPNKTTRRILHVITRLDAGGAASNTLLSVDLLRAAGYATELVYGRTDDPDGRIRDRLRELGVPARAVPAMVRNVAPCRDVCALVALLRCVRRGGYALVHTHCSKAGALGRLAARWAGTPCVHTPHGHLFYGYFGPWPTRIFVAAERRLARLTARIVSLTDLETRESLERGIGSPGQYHTIPSGVPLDAFRALPKRDGAAFRAAWSIPPESFLVLTVGRLVPVKGHDALLDAFSRVAFPAPGAVLAIVGDGPERETLRRRADVLGIEAKVRFAGHCEDVRPALAAADAFVLASRNEGMGRALAEAMAAALPCVATRVGGIPALVDGEQTGLLVPPDSPDALAAAMTRLARDPGLRGRLGRAASQRVYPEYDVSTMICRIAALYEDVLG